MTAKEMFEELKYQRLYLYDEDERDFVREFVVYRKRGNEIVFNTIHKVIEMHIEEDIIDMPLLKAINKQIEELGWNND